MDESRNYLGVAVEGRIYGRVWRVALSDTDGTVRSVSYRLELLNGPPVGTVELDLLEAPDFASVLMQALVLLRDHAEEKVGDSLPHLLGAARQEASIFRKG